MPNGLHRLLHGILIIVMLLQGVGLAIPADRHLDGAGQEHPASPRLSPPPVLADVTHCHHAAHCHAGPPSTEAELGHACDTCASIALLPAATLRAPRRQAGRWPPIARLEGGADFLPAVPLRPPRLITA